MNSFFSKQKLSLIIIFLSLVILVFLPYAFFWHDGEKLGFLPNIITEPDILNQFKSNELNPSEIAKIPSNYSFQPTNEPGYQYENFNLNFESFFGGDEREPHRVYFQSGGFFIEFKLLGGKFHNLILSDYENQKNGQVIYNGILPSVDLIYRINDSGLKEEITLADKKAPNEFLFELNFDKENMFYKKMPDGLWHFFIKENEFRKETDLFKFPQLYMKDKNGERTDKVDINIFQKNNKDYISIKANKEWLLHQRRAFPVIIDPAVVLEGETNIYYATQQPFERHDFRITSGTYAGKMIVIYAKSTTTIYFRSSNYPDLSDTPYTTWTTATQVNTTNTTTGSGTGGTAIMDSNFNVYVAYNRNAGSSVYPLSVMKLSFSAGSWSTGTERDIYVPAASRGQLCPSLEVEKYNNNKLWVAWQYRDNSTGNYSIHVKASTDGGVTWGSGTADAGTELSTLGASNVTYPNLIKYADKLACIYNDQDTGLEWRWREDADADSTWDGPIDTVIIASASIDGHFSVTADNSNNLHLLYKNSNIKYQMGTYSGGTITWPGAETTISSNTSSLYPNIASDGSNIYAFWSEYIGSNQYQLDYKKSTDGISWDGSATIIDSHERCFDKYYYSDGNDFYDDTTDACDTTGSGDVAMYTGLYNQLYFGLSEKFDYMYVDMSTNCTGCTVQWAYYNGSTWSDFTPYSGAYGFTADSRVELWNGIASVPTDWAKTDPSDLGTNYYYVQATRTAGSATPTGNQLTAVNYNSLPSAVINDGLISLVWTREDTGSSSDDIKFTAYNPRSQYWQWFDDTYNATPEKCFTSDASCPNSNENVMATVGVGLKNALKLRYTIKETGGIQMLDGRKRLQYSIGSTFTKRILTNNSDDGTEANDGTWNSNISEVGESSGTKATWEDIGLRFLNVTIPQGATIGSAKITVTAYDNRSGTIGTVIKGIDEDDTLTWSSGSRSSQRTPTTAQVNWSITDAWTANSTYDSADITSIVQEIVDRSGWDGDAAMGFAIEYDSGVDVSRKIYDFNDDTSKAALLQVTYYQPTSTWYNVGEQSTSWWDSNYLYRRAITIKNVTSSNLTNYTVSYQFDHASLVSASPSKSLASGNDVRIVNDSGTQIDRIIDDNTTSYGWNLSTTRIWFKIASLNAFTSVTYYMYFDYSAASAPTGYADRSDVFYKGDAFDDSSLSGIWTTSTPAGTISETTNLSISCTAAVNCDWWSTPHNAPIIYTAFPSGDWYAWVKLNSYTVNSNTHAGIMLYLDRDNVYMWGRYNNSTGAYDDFSIERIVSDSGAINISDLASTTLPMWLRIRKSGTTYYFDYSTDGSTWTNQYSNASLGFTPTSVGMFAKNWSAYNAVNPTFNYFANRYYVYPEPAVTAADYDDGQLWLYFNGVDADDAAITGAGNPILSDAVGSPPDYTTNNLATHNESGTAASTNADHVANAATEWEFTIQNYNGTASSPYGFRLFDNKSNQSVYLNDASYSYPSVQTSAYTLTMDAPSNMGMTDWTLGTAGDNSTQFPSDSKITMTNYRGVGGAGDNWTLSTISTHLFQSVTNGDPVAVGDLNATSAVNQRHLVKYTTGGTTYWVLGYYSTSETAVGFIKSTDNGNSWSEAIGGGTTTVGDADAKNNFSMDIDSSGNIHIAYYDVVTAIPYIKYVKLTYSSGSWTIGTASNVFSTKTASCGNPVIKLQSNGRIWVVFQRDSGLAPTYYLSVYYSDNGSTWTSALSLDSNASGVYTASIASFYGTEESIAVAYYYGTDDDLMWQYHKVSDAVGSWSGEAVVITETLFRFYAISLAGEVTGGVVTSSDTNLHLIYDWDSGGLGSGGIKYKEYNGTNWTSNNKTLSSNLSDVDPMVTCYRDGSTHYTWVYWGVNKGVNDFQIATQYYDGSAWDSSLYTISGTSSKNRRYPAAVEKNKNPAVVWSEYDNSSSYNLYSYITKDFIENDDVTWSTGTISPVYGSQTSSDSGNHTVSAGAGGTLDASRTAVSAITDENADGAGWGNYTIRPTLTIPGSVLNLKELGTYSGVITLTII